jgi:hypothetical protein
VLAPLSWFIRGCFQFTGNRLLAPRHKLFSTLCRGVPSQISRYHYPHWKLPRGPQVPEHPFCDTRAESTPWRARSLTARVRRVSQTLDDSRAWPEVRHVDPTVHGLALVNFWFILLHVNKVKFRARAPELVYSRKVDGCR